MCHSFVWLENFYYDCCAGPIVGKEGFEAYYFSVVDIMSRDAEIAEKKKAITHGAVVDESPDPITPTR